MSCDAAALHEAEWRASAAGMERRPDSRRTYPFGAEEPHLWKWVISEKNTSP